MKPPPQTIALPFLCASIRDTRETARRRLDALRARLERAYWKHRKEVLFVDPWLGRALVAEGLAEPCAVSDYDTALDGPKFRYDPRHHYPIRIKRVAVQVPKPAPKGPALVLPGRLAAKAQRRETSTTAPT